MRDETSPSTGDAACNDCGDSELPRPEWDEAPLRTKIVMLTLLCAVGGTLVGMAEAMAGYQIWPMAAGLTILVTAGLVLGQQWVCRPYDSLIGLMRVVQHRKRLAELEQLPTHRGDEIGHIARSLHELATAAFACTQENRRLRRTLDHRIEKAVDRATRQLQQLTMRDPLTGLGNRRFVDDNLNALIDSVRAADDDLLCLMIDVDHFKQVNDQLGHKAGDNLLVFLAELIRGCIRRQDYAVRLGGDEFAVFLPACEPERGEQLGRQIIAMFSQCTRSTLPGEIGCGLSIGISSLQRDLLGRGVADGETGGKMPLGQMLIDIADGKLYEAKQGGKSRIAGG